MILLSYNVFKETFILNEEENLGLTKDTDLNVPNENIGPPNQNYKHRTRRLQSDSKLLQRYRKG